MIKSINKKLFILLLFLVSTLWIKAQEPRLLIISHQKFEKPTKELALWKNQTGTKTAFVLTNQIKTDPGSRDIRDFIWQANDTAIEPFNHILLIGDHSLLPPFYGVNNSLTDHPYSLKDTLDFLPDYHVGRFSVFTSG
jgi:hypothetical protein